MIDRYDNFKDTDLSKIKEIQQLFIASVLR